MRDELSYFTPEEIVRAIKKEEYPGFVYILPDEMVILLRKAVDDYREKHP